MTMIERARSMIDTPFIHQGRDRNGIDCIGLIVYAMDYPIAKVPAYPRDPFKSELETAMTAAFGEPLLCDPTLDELQEGDIVVMQYKGPIRHVGIIANHEHHAGYLSLIHTDSNLDKVTEHIIDFKWLRRFKKVWRLGIK